MSHPPVSRRRFLALLPGMGLAGLASVSAAPLGAAFPGARRRPDGHPDPRPGIDGSKVLPADALSGYPDLVPLFDGIRKHAALADGVLCYCGCAELPGYRSLLTCFEEGFDMARFCPICQGQGRLLVGRADEGQNLEQIRRAIDARFSSGGDPHAAAPGDPGDGGTRGAATAEARRRLLARVPGRLGALLVAAFGTALALPFGADAQVRASERSVFAQTIDGTTVTVDYSRPRARGRAPLFGEVVPWGKVWTPGANRATTLSADEDVTLNGHPLAAGTYSVWIVVREHEDWEVVIDPDSTRFHTQPPDSAEGQLRFPVRPREGDSMEALTWYAPTYGASGMTLLMHWGTTIVPIEVGVEPTERVAATAAEAAPVVGSWTIEWLIPREGTGAEDPAQEAAGGQAGEAASGGGPAAGRGEAASRTGGPATAPEGAPTRASETGAGAPFQVTHRDDGSLYVTTSPPDAPHWPDPLELILLPRAEGVFVPALAMAGELAEPMQGLFVEFVVEGDAPAASFEIRTGRDDLMARGTRSAPAGG